MWNRNIVTITGLHFLEIGFHALSTLSSCSFARETVLFDKLLYLLVHDFLSFLVVLITIYLFLCG